MIVVDASVGLKWIFPIEEGSKEAISLIEKVIKEEEVLAVPDIFYYEIANALVYKTGLEVGKVIGGFKEIYDAETEIISLNEEDFITALKFAKEYKITLYDASYVTLAKKLNCDFLTADKTLVEKLKNLPFVKSI